MAARETAWNFAKVPDAGRIDGREFQFRFVNNARCERFGARDLAEHHSVD
jgi:hypothetical protein